MLAVVTKHYLVMFVAIFVIYTIVFNAYFSEIDEQSYLFLTKAERTTSPTCAPCYSEYPKGLLQKIRFSLTEGPQDSECFNLPKSINMRNHFFWKKTYRHFFHQSKNTSPCFSIWNVSLTISEAPWKKCFLADRNVWMNPIVTVFCMTFFPVLACYLLIWYYFFWQY